jgi:hypothetical protein
MPEMTVKPDDFSEVPLTKHDICDLTDDRCNPHELLIAICAKCRDQEHYSRQCLQEKGWRLFGTDYCVAADGNGFTVCPDCSRWDYSWDDLY